MQSNLKYVIFGFIVIILVMIGIWNISGGTNTEETETAPPDVIKDDKPDGTVDFTSLFPPSDTKVNVGIGGDNPKTDVGGETIKEPLDPIIRPVLDKPTITPISNPEFVTYEVKPGDSLWKIAARELNDPSMEKEIQKLNGLSTDMIRVGQKLKLPKKGAAAIVAPIVPMPGTDTPTTPSGIPPVVSADKNGLHETSGKWFYTIKPGDRLISISKKVYGSEGKWKEIAQANPGLDPSKLKIGQDIQIPNYKPSIP